MKVSLVAVFLPPPHLVVNQQIGRPSRTLIEVVRA